MTVLASIAPIERKVDRLCLSPGSAEMEEAIEP